MPPKSLTKGSTWPKTGKAPCRICNNLDTQGSAATLYDSESTSRADIILHLAVDLLQLVHSRERCRFCRLLVQALDHFEERWKTIRQPLLIEIRRGEPIRVRLDSRNMRHSRLDIYVPMGTRPPWPSIGNAWTLSADLTIEDKVNFARRCIDHCVAKHPLCTDTTARKMPTRLLYVGGARNHIKLCKVSGTSHRYAALSHCWGDGVQCSTLSSNFKTRSNGFDERTLPLLFKLAVMFTQELGIDYLWIDALCIIQDDPNDWAKESSKMMHIYRHAEVTLSAILCENSKGSILPSGMPPTKLRYENASGKTTTLKARKIDDHHPDTENKTPPQFHGPLTTRAWTYQEHLISPRLLHFDPTEIAFECRTGFRCECSPNPIKCATTPRILHSIPRNRIWKTWHDVVSQYSKRNMTFPVDKLPAIAGVAQYFQEHVVGTDSHYLAGLWEANLPFDLLWTSSATLASPHSVARLTDFRAPSFSWASIDIPILYHESDTDAEDEDVQPQSDVRILEAQYTTADANFPLGPVSAGHILLEGMLAEGTLIAPENYEFSYYLRLAPDQPSVPVAPDTLLVARDRTKGDVTQHTVYRGTPQDEYRPFTATVWCLRLTSSSTLGISGLILGPSTRDSGGMERLGYFSCGHEWFIGATQRRVKLV